MDLQLTATRCLRWLPRSLGSPPANPLPVHRAPGALEAPQIASAIFARHEVTVTASAGSGPRPRCWCWGHRETEI